MISKKVLLQYPNFDLPFEIYVDASKYKLGGIIQQAEKPLIFWSKRKAESQEKYSVMKSEFLAMVELLKEFRNILLGRKIIICTYHEN